jgi:gluconolactonase
MRTLWLMACGLLVAAVAALPAASEQKEPAMPKEAPKAGIEVVDEVFKDVAAPDAKVRQVGSGLKFTEGPTWFEDGKFFVFSDIPANAIYRWAEGEEVKVWRQPTNGANGNTVDRQGRLVTCEGGGRTVTRTGKDGKIETLCSTYKGKKLNAPNDVVVKTDGTIWFTDPPYGVKAADVEQETNNVYRLDPGAKEPVAVITDMTRPNGLCFSPDEKFLYVANSDTKIHNVRRFRVKADNTLEGGDVFVTIDPGVPDGMRCDRDGRLYSSAGDGVQVFSTEGKLLGRIRTPETAANCAFGGPEFRTLFITARTGVWAVDLKVPGAK